MQNSRSVLRIYIPRKPQDHKPLGWRAIAFYEVTSSPRLRLGSCWPRGGAVGRCHIVLSSAPSLPRRTTSVPISLRAQPKTPIKKISVRREFRSTNDEAERKGSDHEVVFRRPLQEHNPIAQRHQHPKRRVPAGVRARPAYPRLGATQRIVAVSLNLNR